MPCQGCLRDSISEFCETCVQTIFFGEPLIFPLLSFRREECAGLMREQATEVSIAGIQDKLGLYLENCSLMPTTTQIQYMLKPLPTESLEQFPEDLPANEHVTMQIARQAYSIPTALNAILFFDNGEPAYLCQRFDRKRGKKLRQEDFCQLSQCSEATEGPRYKYSRSYEDCGQLIKRYCETPAVQLDRLFTLIVFQYVFSNGDAHLKNFSLQVTDDGTFMLAPAYDLRSTHLHSSKKFMMALELFNDSYESPFFQKHGFFGRECFLELAKRMDLNSIRAQLMLTKFHSNQDKALRLIERSFLSAGAKKQYLADVKERLQAIAP